MHHIVARTARLATLLLLIAVPLSATPGQEAAATLLLPYFEVDLTAGAEGQTTLFSVNNAGQDKVVAHVVTWTDWGIPTYSFDVVLGPDDVQTINLRNLFATGSVPMTDGSAIDGCADPTVAPPLDLEALRRAHSGRPSAEDGLCRGSGRLGEGVVTGYVTVDTARTCAGTGPYFPSDADYFRHTFGGVPPEPFATAENVLWGDVFYVASEDDSAQGTELVHIPFAADTAAGETFYRQFQSEGQDGRVLLGSSYRGRFLDGGPFDGGTDLLVWLESTQAGAPTDCGPRQIDAFGCFHARFTIYNEAGAATDETRRSANEVAFRLEVGSDELPATPPFGFVRLDYAMLDHCVIDPPQFFEPLQAWLVPVMMAKDRFSVALTATRVAPPE